MCRTEIRMREQCRAQSKAGLIAESEPALSCISVSQARLPLMRRKRNVRMTAPTTATTDGVDEAATARVSECAHDETTNNGADDADDDVTKNAIAAALHDFAGNKAGDKADDDPPDE